MASHIDAAAYPTAALGRPASRLVDRVPTDRPYVPRLHGGEPGLPSAPLREHFVAWMRRTGASSGDAALTVGWDENHFARLWELPGVSLARADELCVKLFDDPGLLYVLYPELDGAEPRRTQTHQALRAEERAAKVAAKKAEQAARWETIARLRRRGATSALIAGVLGTTADRVDTQVREARKAGFNMPSRAKLPRLTAAQRAATLCP